MDDAKLIRQTASAFEEYLIMNRDCASGPLDDIKLLASWYDDVVPDLPGTYAKALANRAIEEFGPDGEKLQSCEGCSEEELKDDLKSCDFASLEGWLDTYFSSGELVMLDLILWEAHKKGY